MVFGNMGDDSGTGVAFTRNPSTGENSLYGEFLINAQGEDVVAGIRTPEQIARLRDRTAWRGRAVRRDRPAPGEHYRDIQDMEFTVERGKLYMLQTRTGKRTAQAAVKIAVDMVHEGLITKEEAVMRVEPGQVGPAPAAPVRPRCQGEGDQGWPAAGQGAERLPRRRGRQGHLRPR